jgi:HPt (histidine-containing phosphotransfer) domain-containing protein
MTKVFDIGDPHGADPMDALSDMFHEAALDDLARLRAILACADQSHCWGEEAHSILHNLKGQGATFGYGFVTELADLGCAILRNRARPNALDQAPHLISAVERGLEITLSNRLKGDADDKRHALLARLKALSGVETP